MESSSLVGKKRQCKDKKNIFVEKDASQSYKERWLKNEGDLKIFEFSWGALACMCLLLA